MKTKRIALFVAMMLCCIVALAQTKYIVDVRSTLNVRAEPNSGAEVLGKVANGDEVLVYNTENGWALIDYGNRQGWVSSKYLRDHSSAPKREAKKDSSNKIDVQEILNSWVGGVRPYWLTYFIVGLSAILWLFRFKRDDDELEGGWYIGNLCMFFALVVAEIAYVLMMGSKSIWFCYPDDVGWLMTIVNFILFGLVVYNQIMTFIETMGDVQYNNGSYIDTRWGIYSWIGGLIAAVICGIFFSKYMYIVGIAFLVLQLIQIFLIFKNRGDGGVLGAFLFLGVYLFGSIATMLILVHFLTLLIIVLIGLLVLTIFAHSGSSSSNNRCSNCSHYTFGRCTYRDEYISSPSTTTCSHHS